MSGIVGSKLNIRGSGRIAKLGTDGQVLTSAGAGVSAAFEDAAGGGEITTAGEVFSNYNAIGSNVTTTTASTKNMFLMGIITVSSSYTWTVDGDGTLTILG